MKLKKLEVELSVCKVENYKNVDLTKPFTFIGVTDEENSLVCPTAFVPENCVQREDEWKAFRIEGELDFSLIGILSKIATILAQESIGIFAISTYNTDYVLCKKENFEKALHALADAGYTIE